MTLFLGNSKREYAHVEMCWKRIAKQKCLHEFLSLSNHWAVLLKKCRGALACRNVRRIEIEFLFLHKHIMCHQISLQIFAAGALDLNPCVSTHICCLMDEC